MNIPWAAEIVDLGHSVAPSDIEYPSRCSASASSALPAALTPAKRLYLITSLAMVCNCMLEVPS